jgi:anti-sigma B factor antagonist
MLIEIQDADGGAVKIVRVGESINFANVRDFNAAANKLLDSGVDKLVLDLEKVEFCNSHGFAVMINLYLKISKAGGKFAILKPKKAILEVLSITKMDSIIPIFQEEKKAVAALKVPTA